MHATAGCRTTSLATGARINPRGDRAPGRRCAVLPSAGPRRRCGRLGGPAMKTRTQLPPGLEPWGEALGALQPEFVSGLLPMLHGVDDLIHRRDAGQGDSGPLDGYAGIANRGTPERILISEWLLADEAPMEFLRRASEHELMYLAPAHS